MVGHFGGSVASDRSLELLTGNLPLLPNATPPCWWTFTISLLLMIYYQLLIFSILPKPLFVDWLPLKFRLRSSWNLPRQRHGKLLNTPDICQNHHYRWLCINVTKCKILQFERKKTALHTQFCHKTTFVATLRKSKIPWPEIAVV